MARGSRHKHRAVIGRDWGTTQISCKASFPERLHNGIRNTYFTSFNRTFVVPLSLSLICSYSRILTKRLQSHAMIVASQQKNCPITPRFLVEILQNRLWKNGRDEVRMLTFSDSKNTFNMILAQVLYSSTSAASWWRKLERVEGRKYRLDAIIAKNVL